MSSAPESKPLPPRQLLLMRHAKSSWADPGMADFDRPLNERGQIAAKRMGRKLRESGIDVDLILGSTAARVRQTLALAVPAWGTSAPPFLSKELYLASHETLLRHLRAVDDSLRRVLIVAHNPGMADLLSWFTEHPEHFPTGAIALLEPTTATSSWATALSESDWTLREFWKPKELED